MSPAARARALYRSFENGETIGRTVRLPTLVDEALEELAEQRGVTVAQLVREAVRTYCVPAVERELRRRAATVASPGSTPGAAAGSSQSYTRR